MKFTLEIELGNDAMRRYSDILAAIQSRLGSSVGSFAELGDADTIRDINGATVGKWDVRESIEVREDIQQDSIATLLWDYLKRDPEHKDRRQTGYGTKTKQGLYLSISNILKQTGGIR